MYRKISNFDFLWEKTYDTLMKTTELTSIVENFEKQAMVLYQTLWDIYYVKHYGTLTKLCKL